MTWTQFKEHANAGFGFLGVVFGILVYFQNVLVECGALTRFVISGVRVVFDVCLFLKRVD